MTPALGRLAAPAYNDLEIFRVFTMTTQRTAAALAALLVLSLCTTAALAQSGRARGADVDLAARLREVQSDAKQFEASYKLGRKVASFCANCHGEGGNSTKSDIPNLAGQNPAYVLEQVRQFAEGKRRNEFMEGLIKALNTEEKVGVVLYYTQQEVTHKPATDPALAARGKAYYDKICFRCHGEQGHGSDKFARVAGQQRDYLTLSLKRYRDGGGVRIDPLMAANTKHMTDGDIAAVVAYVSSMK